MILNQAANLEQFNERFKRITSSSDSEYQQQLDLQRLKSDMEIVLSIPPMTDERYKEENPEVMSLYRRIKSRMV